MLSIVGWHLAGAFTLPLHCPSPTASSDARTFRAQFQAQRNGAAAVSMRAAGRPKIAFIQTGGTIDKDYPKSTMGYAFEIADAATERVIADASHVPLSSDFDFQTACRKVIFPECHQP